MRRALVTWPEMTLGRQGVCASARLREKGGQDGGGVPRLLSRDLRSY